MSAVPAARLTDTISHTDAGFGFGLGGAIGLGVGLALLTIATGGADLAVLAAVGGAVALTGGGALMGMRIGATYGNPVGDITTGSPNVIVNSLLAARTLADVAICADHNSPQPIATGSTSVFINGMPAARLGDLTVCDAAITSASGNVFIGGGTAAYAAISAEVSPVLVDIATDMAIGGTAVALGAGAGAAFAAAGWAGVGVFGLQAAGGLAGGIGGGMAGGAIGQALGGARGQAWGQAIGGLAGGVGGASGAGRLGGAIAGEGGANSPQILASRSANDLNAEMEAAGNSGAWQPGTNVINRIDPPGTQYNMVVSEGQAAALMRGQPAFGGWATSDDVTSQAFARNDLAITDGFKPDVSQVATVEATAPQEVNAGTVGPQGDLQGGAQQVQFVGQRNLKLVGPPRPLPPE